jgi:hypothetical protein
MGCLEYNLRATGKKHRVSSAQIDDERYCQSFGYLVRLSEIGGTKTRSISLRGDTERALVPDARCQQIKTFSAHTSSVRKE